MKKLQTTKINGKDFTEYECNGTPVDEETKAERRERILKDLEKEKKDITFIWSGDTFTVATQNPHDMGRYIYECTPRRIWIEAS